MQGNKYEPDCTCLKCGRLMCSRCAKQLGCTFCGGSFCSHCLEDHLKACRHRKPGSAPRVLGGANPEKSLAVKDSGTKISDRAVVLFLPPYEVAEDIEEWYVRLPKYCTPLFGKAMCMLRADPPYQDDDPEGVSYYVKPSAHRDEDVRRKDLRRHILASIANTQLGRDLGRTGLNLLKAHVGPGAIVEELLMTPHHTVTKRRMVHSVS